MKKCNALFRILLCLLSVVATTTIWADNVARVSSATGVPGTELELSVSLSVTDPIVGIQMDLDLPQELSCVAGSVTLNPERANGHSISASQDGDKLKVVVYSLSKAKLIGEEGILFTFRLKLGDTPDVYLLAPTITLVSETSSSVSCSVGSGSVTILASRLEVQTTKVDFGHIAIGGQYSCDIVVSNTGTKALLVSDVKHQVDGLQLDATSFALAAGASRTLHLNYSPVVRGAFQEVLTILSDADNGEQTIMVSADPYAVNELHTGSAEGISDSEVTVTLCMNNMDPIVGVQCSYRLPKELQYVVGSVALTERADGHGVSASVTDGVLTIIVYSTSKKVLLGNDGDLLTFRLLLNGSGGAYPLEPENVVLGMEGNVNVVSAVSAGEVKIQCPTLLAPTSLAMDPAPLTQCAQVSLLLNNPSSLPLIVSGVGFQNDGYDVSCDFPFEIRAHSDTILTVSYQSDVAGDFSSVINIFSNDPELRICTVPVSGTLYEPNTITVEQMSASNGEYVFAVTADNYSVSTGFQTDVCLTGMGVTAVEVTLGSRASAYAASLKQLDDQTWRLLVYSFDKSAEFNGHRGELVKLCVKVSGTVGSDARLTLQNVVLSGRGNDNLLTPGGQLSCAVVSDVPLRKLVNVSIYEGENYVDKTRVVFNNDASMEYEIQCDAAKFIAETASLQLYSLDSSGNQYAINERPADIGCVPLGIKVRKCKEYTFVSTRMDEAVLLFDRDSLTLHDLSASPYTFYTDPGTYNDRFQLLIPPTSHSVVDVNADGKMSIADITALVNILKRRGTIKVNAATADVDDDGCITIDDLRLLQNKILQ